MFNPKKILKNATPALGVTAGAVGAKYAAKYIPIADPKIQSAVLFLGGLVLSGMKEKGMLHFAGLGLAAGGGIALLESFGIGGPADPIMDLDEIDGYDDELNGVPEAVYGLDTEESDNDLETGSY